DAVAGRAEFLDATRLATGLMGDSIAANLFMLGYAFQRGAIPVSLQALMRAIELNGVAVVANQQAFQWGRQAAVDMGTVERLVSRAQPIVVQLPETLGAMVKKRVKFLTAYQNSAYAAEYQAFVDGIQDAERRAG